VPDALTVRWDIPKQINDGRWIVTSPDDEGVGAEDDWFPQPEETSIINS
jgi:hypothetical protein